MPLSSSPPAPAPARPSHGESNEEPPVCRELPTLVSSFVDTFVDYIVGGQFLGKEEEEIEGTKKKSTSGEGYGVHNKIPTYRPPVDRLIAIGDIHGDLSKAKESLKIAGVMDDNDRWIGGKTTVVQVGDLLDRGGEELRVIYLLEKLGRQARKCGGDLIVMNGNHEIMNIEGDFRYATHSSSLEFQHWSYWYERGNKMKEVCDGIRRRDRLISGDNDSKIPDTIPSHLKARFAALRPGGPISSRFLSKHPTVLVIGKTVFAHGGILPSHASYGLERMNEEVREWILGKKGHFGPRYLHGRDAVVWVRKYSEIKERLCDCDVLEKALEAIQGSKRMIVGHTIQQPFGINGACMNRVIRVDVGMSSGCGGAPPEVLEIKNDENLRVLSKSERRDIEKSVPEQPFWKKRNDGLSSLLSETSVK